MALLSLRKTIIFSSCLYLSVFVGAVLFLTSGSLATQQDSDYHIWTQKIPKRTFTEFKTPWTGQQYSNDAAIICGEIKRFEYFTEKTFQLNETTWRAGELAAITSYDVGRDISDSVKECKSDSSGSLCPDQKLLDPQQYLDMLLFKETDSSDAALSVWVFLIVTLIGPPCTLMIMYCITKRRPKSAKLLWLAYLSTIFIFRLQDRFIEMLIFVAGWRMHMKMFLAFLATFSAVCLIILNDLHYINLNPERARSKSSIIQVLIFLYLSNALSHIAEYISYLGRLPYAYFTKPLNECNCECIYGITISSYCAALLTALILAYKLFMMLEATQICLFREIHLISVKKDIPLWILQKMTSAHNNNFEEVELHDNNIQWRLDGSSTQCAPDDGTNAVLKFYKHRFLIMFLTISIYMSMLQMVVSCMFAFLSPMAFFLGNASCVSTIYFSIICVCFVAYVVFVLSTIRETIVLLYGEEDQEIPISFLIPLEYGKGLTNIMLCSGFRGVNQEKVRKIRKRYAAFYGNHKCSMQTVEMT